VLDFWPPTRHTSIPTALVVVEPEVEAEPLGAGEQRGAIAEEEEEKEEEEER
jgi:hypothetical protein